jgi:putative FmdB family regulatory protein
VPVYEYRCVTCDGVFEQRRAMADADAAAMCPQGHTEVRRLLSVFAAGGRATDGGSSMAPSPAPMRGCGGGCACH